MRSSATRNKIQAHGDEALRAGRGHRQRGPRCGRGIAAVASITVEAPAQELGRPEGSEVDRGHQGLGDVILGRPGLRRQLDEDIT